MAPEVLVVGGAGAFGGRCVGRTVVEILQGTQNCPPTRAPEGDLDRPGTLGPGTSLQGAPETFNLESKGQEKEFFVKARLTSSKPILTYF